LAPGATNVQYSADGVVWQNIGTAAEPNWQVIKTQP
jgi:hypothetical protein